MPYLQTVVCSELLKLVLYIVVLQSVVIDSAIYLLTINSLIIENIAMSLYNILVKSYLNMKHAFFDSS